MYLISHYKTFILFISRQKLKNQFLTMAEEVQTSYQVRLQRFCSEFDVRTAAAPLVQFAEQHPFLALFIGVAAAFAFLPFLIFCMFVIMTFLGTLVGFLMVEGMLLSIATVMLLMTLIGVVCISFFFTSFLVLMWFTAMTGSAGVQSLKQSVQARAAHLQNLKMSQRKSHETQQQFPWQLNHVQAQRIYNNKAQQLNQFNYCPTSFRRNTIDLVSSYDEMIKCWQNLHRLRKDSHHLSNCFYSYHILADRDLQEIILSFATPG